MLILRLILKRGSATWNASMVGRQSARSWVIDGFGRLGRCAVDGEKRGVL